MAPYPAVFLTLSSRDPAPAAAHLVRLGVSIGNEASEFATAKPHRLRRALLVESPMQRERKHELLANLPVFEGLSAQAIDELVEVSRVETHRARGDVFRKGDPGTQLYVVASGLLKVTTTSGDGEDLVFSLLGPGEVFGEISACGGGPRSASVVAKEKSELLAIDRRDFMAFLRRHPDTAIGLLELLAARVRHLSEMLEDAQFLNLPFRLAKRLCDLAERYGETTAKGVRLDMRMSQREWGELVGASREAINRQMRSWSELGIVTMDGGHLTIHDEEELDRLSHCIVA